MVGSSTDMEVTVLRLPHMQIVLNKQQQRQREEVRRSTRLTRLQPATLHGAKVACGNIN